jgi:hypothetical protein
VASSAAPPKGKSKVFVELRVPLEKAPKGAQDYLKGDRLLNDMPG